MAKAKKKTAHKSAKAKNVKKPMPKKAMKSAKRATAKKAAPKKKAAKPKAKMVAKPKAKMAAKPKAKMAAKPKAKTAAPKKAMAKPAARAAKAASPVSGPSKSGIASRPIARDQHAGIRIAAIAPERVTRAPRPEPKQLVLFAVSVERPVARLALRPAPTFGREMTPHDDEE